MSYCIMFATKITFMYISDIFLLLLHGVRVNKRHRHFQFQTIVYFRRRFFFYKKMSKTKTSVSPYLRNLVSEFGKHILISDRLD